MLRPVQNYSVIAIRHVHISSVLGTHRNHSSHLYMNRQRKDPYVKKAQEFNFRARSAFKFFQIHEKFDLIRYGDVAVECGCVPGAWTQALISLSNSAGKRGKYSMGRVISIDINVMTPLNGATFILGDITKPETHERICAELGKQKANIVVSDMAPNATGDSSLDHERIMRLCRSALELAVIKVLRPGGTFLCKLWGGPDREKLQKVMEQLFNQVDIVKPHASRTDSAEIFMLGRGFVGIEKE